MGRSHFLIQAAKVVLIVFLLLTVNVIVLNSISHAANTHAYANNNFNVFGLNIPQNLMFCGEKIPADNYEIRLNLEKEFFSNTYWKNNSAILFNKAARWFPYIEPILKEEGVPDDIKYIAVIESHLSNERSPAGAVGFWQLVQSTAINYGLLVNEEVDERLDVERSTRAACKLIKEAHARLNNWTLATAAYNLGIGGIERALKKQGTNNYYDLLLNQETGEFVYRVLAYKTLLSDPDHFGIRKKSQKRISKIPVKIFAVDSTITDLRFLAKKLGCSKAMVKLFNPWLVGESLKNDEKRTYKFRIPKDLKRDYSAYFADLLTEDGFMHTVDEHAAPAQSEQKDTLLVH